MPYMLEKLSKNPYESTSKLVDQTYAKLVNNLLPKWEQNKQVYKATI